uniref:Putative secreted protein n=1 Tax=Anopheles darlingi TaxID=43151 RepID=A0A2M4DCE4_ANODA
MFVLTGCVALAAGAVSTGMATLVAATRDFWSIIWASGSPAAAPAATTATTAAPPTSPAVSERAAAAVVGPVATVLISCPPACS